LHFLSNVFPGSSYIDLGQIGAQTDSNAAGLVTLTGSGSSTVVTPSGILWAFAMFSRYIRPDAVRVATTGAPSNTNIAAFENSDGTVVVVMVNGGSSTESVSLGGYSAAEVSATYMDNSVSAPATFAATVSDGNVEATLPAYSVVTFVLTGGSVPPASTTTTSKATSTSTTTTSKATSTSTTTTSAAATGTGVSQEYGQCGGLYWTGPTACASPWTCEYQNAYYSQCL
jgi:hypothetical protein